MSKNELAILGLLKEGEKYGYQIHQQVSERNMDIWAKISISSIYNTLNNLRDRGMIKARRLKVGKTPERSMYEITSTGERVLSGLVEGYLDTRDMGEYPFGLGVAFISSLPEQTAVGLIQKRILRLQDELYSLTEKMNGLKGQIPMNWFLLIKNGCNHIESELRWCRELLSEIENAGNWGEFCASEGTGGENDEAY
jgi:DNA-binding PadR family transcriptional regulator